MTEASAKSVPPLQPDPGVTKVDRVVLPRGGAAEVVANGAVVDVGGLPVSAKAPVGATDDFLSGARIHNGVSAGLGRVKLTVADPKLAEAAGVRGVLLTASRIDGHPSGGRNIDLTVDYAGFSQLYGGDFGNRLRLVQLPACALTAPQDRKCQAQLDLGSVNAGGRVSAQVALSDTAKATAMPKAGAAGAEEPAALTEAGGPAVFAVTAGANSHGATFDATSLSPTYSWAAGGQGGSFSWSYPLKVPASLGGPAPELALSYDSGSVDGKTLAANGQASWVGEGWDLQAGGFIERSYRTCVQDGWSGANGDLCWFSSHNATLMLGGRSFKLIRDAASGVWRTDDDNGWRIEQRFGGGLGNGDNDDEHWVVTTLEGIQYWFGRHKRYGADTQVTNSVQTVPVWGGDGEPCGGSWCMQGYRWNLDYVHDPSGNSMTYFYAEWRGLYGFNGNCCGAIEYDISAHLDHIDYGQRVGSEASSPAPMRVDFVRADRCVGSCARVEHLDTPWDLFCETWSSCAGRTSPTFWTPYRLGSVITQVRKADGSGYRKVDQWNTTHIYPSTGDNIAPAGDDTSPNLWLASLTHHGFAADGTTELAEPTMTFAGGAAGPLPNRVDWGSDLGIAPYMHYRLSQIDNGVGGRTTVSYTAGDCPLRDYKPAPGFNPYRCFPQHHKPAQAAAGYGWFHKYVVASVTEQDLTAAGSPAETWSYAYSVDPSTDASLWGHDFTETTVLDYRSWSVWKGYAQVTTTHGVAGGPQTTSRALYHRGMDGDSVATTDNQAMVWEGRRAQMSAWIDTPGQSAAVGGRGGRCMEVSWADTAAGTPVRLWDCHGAAWQQWRYTLHPSSYQLTLSSPHSGRCLQPSGSSAGAVLQIADCTSSSLQKWRFTPDGGLSNVATGMCADVLGAGVAAGTAIGLYTCAGTPNQKWSPRSDGSLFAPQSHRCMAVAGGSSANGTAIVNWKCDGQATQVWQYQPSGSSMRNAHTNKCLDVAGSGTTDGTLVQLYDCNNSPAQTWVPQADGTLKNPNSGKCLDARDPPADGVQLYIWTCQSNVPQQQWAHLIVDAEALAGQPREQYTQDGSTVLASEITSYSVTHTGTRPKPIVGGQDLKSYMARPTDVKTRTWIAASGNWRWTRDETSYDAYGLLAGRKDHGDMATTADDTCVNPTYNRNTTLHLIDLVKEAVVTSCGLQSGDADVLSGQHFFYDNATTDAAPTKGLLTKTNAISAVAGGAKTWVQQARAVHDGNGRVVESDDALDRKTATAYTPSSGAPVTSTAVTGPMGTGWTTTIDIEPGHGVPTKVIDVNGKATTGQYDPLGRLTKVWRDNRATNTTPHQQYTYNLSTSPSWMHTQQLGPNGNQISAYQIFDGRLRPRQSQTVTEDSKRAITDTRYDGRGLVAKETTFYNNQSAPSAGLVDFLDTGVDRQTRYEYDQLARPTKQQLFKNNTLQFESTTVYDGDRTGIIPPAGGTVTQDIVDARGRVVEKRQYQSPTALSGAFAKTTYGHDRQGQLTSVADPANNTWTYEHDLLGRKTKSIDPDAGTSETKYDVAGQVISTKDARGQELHYEYDPLGRKTKQRDGSAVGPVMAVWTYDTYAKGQLAIATRHVGSDLYKTRITARDDGYRPLHVEVEIPNSTVNGALAGTYAWDYTYKPNGAPATAVLPVAGGLPAETLTHTYDNNGFAQTLAGTWTGGSQTYIANITYAYDGLITEQFLGATGKRVRVAHSYYPGTRRLQGTFTDLETATVGTFTNKYVYDYAYDPAGNITNAGTLTDGVRDQMECFRYDHLRRLTEAWTQAAFGTGCITPQRAGADPYWRQWTFDSIGNRLAQTDKNPTGGDTAWTYTVGNAGGVKPHQVKQVTATGPLAGTPTRSYSYDDAGNTLTATTPTGAAQTLGWDKEGHLAAVTDAGTPTAEYVYDADGKRLIARTPAKTTLYLPDGTELELASDGGAPLGTRYYNGVAVRDPSGLKWTCTNHQNTSTIQIDATTLAATRRRMLPYGEDRGTQPTGWMGTKGYVGGTKDPSGYVHLGAREYDPTLGRFISVDPIMDLTDPQQWHAYAYANNSPVTFADPDGLRAKEEKSGGVPNSGTGKHLNPKPKGGPKPAPAKKTIDCSSEWSCLWQGFAQTAITIINGEEGCYGKNCAPGTGAPSLGEIFNWQTLCGCDTRRFDRNHVATPEERRLAAYELGSIFGGTAAIALLAKISVARPTALPAKTVPDPSPQYTASGAPNRSSAVYINVRDTNGTLMTVGSKPGYHAEDVAQGRVPGGQMSQPFGWRRNPESGELVWRPIDVCATCQAKYPPWLFPPGTGGAPGGDWGR